MSDERESGDVKQVKATKEYEDVLSVLAQDILSDLKQVKATLTRVDVNMAEWVLDSGEHIRVRVYAYIPDYIAIDNDEFRKWTESTLSILKECDMDHNSLLIPGKLSLSVSGKFVVGWEEDMSDQNSMMLLVGEIMQL